MNRNVFQSNAGAILGSNWGDVSPQNSQGLSQAPPVPLTAPAHRQNFYDDDSSCSDEEDAPLQMASWGTQSTAKDGTTEITVTAAGWASLIDPNVKVKAGGVGSGGLHRKGTNYKPVDEGYIINQRLKKQPIPKAATGEKKQGKKYPPSAKPKKQFGTYSGHSNVAATINNNRHNTSSSGSSNMSSASSTPRRQPLPTGTGWASGQLSSAPFWQSGGLSESKYATKPPPGSTHNVTSPAAPHNVNNSNHVVHKPQVTTSQSRPTGDGLSASRWAQPVSPDNKTSSVQPKPQVSTSQSGMARPGLAASKWAQPISPVSENTGFDTSRLGLRRTPSTSSVEETSGRSTPSNSQYEPTTPPTVAEPPARKLVFNIELAPGISATLTVEGDDYMGLVDRFAEKHHLSIAENSKKAFAEKIKALVEAQFGS